MRMTLSKATGRSLGAGDERPQRRTDHQGGHKEGRGGWEKWLFPARAGGMMSILAAEPERRSDSRKRKYAHK